MKIVQLLFAIVFFSIWGQQSASAQIALQYSDTTTCPGQPLQMCAALTGQSTGLSTDDQYSIVVNIGFPFVYFGNTYTQCVASGNGFISFDVSLAYPTYGPWYFGQTPSAQQNCIYAAFGDWYSLGGGKIRYQVVGNPGSRRFIMEWCHLPTFLGGNCANLLITTQIILYEGTNVIEVHTTDLPSITPPCPTASPNNRIVQGLESPNGTISYFPAYKDPTGPLASNWGNTGRFHDAERFTPNGQNTYTMDSIPFNPWIIIDSANSPDLKWFAEGQPNVPIGTGSCVSVTANANVNYYAVTFNGFTGCENDSASFADTVHIHFGTTHDTSNVEICAGSTYSWYGRNLFAAGNYDTLFHSALGCDSFYRLHLIVNPLPDMSIKGSPNVQICDGSATTLFLLNPQAGTTYQWTKDGYPIAGETGSSIKVSQGGKYNVTGTTAKGCTATSQAFTLTVNPIPVAKIIPISNDIICAYDTLEISANPGTAYDYKWTPEKPFRVVTGAEGQKVKGVFIDPTTEVVLTVFNQYGCYDSDSIIVQTKPCCQITTPNAFTPNGDGLNDYFNPTLQAGQILLNFLVYDRYGKQVYNNEDIKLGWNGKYKNGEEAPSGVYMYYLKYTCSDGKLYEKKESVTLLR